MLLRRTWLRHSRLILLVGLLTANSLWVFGQRIENIFLEQVGSKIIIHYDFIGANANNFYQVKAYHSINGFNKAISLARGDVGERISPGKSKKIEWYAQEELGTYKGDLIIELRVFLAPESIYIQTPSDKTKLKRGATLSIQWSGGINDDKVSIMLIRNGIQAETIANNIDNNGSFSWMSPGKIKPSKSYEIQISGSGDSGAQSSSGQFTIARKVPLWLLIAPVAVVGATVAIIISSGDNGGEDNNLPGAPDPN